MLSLIRQRTQRLNSLNNSIISIVMISELSYTILHGVKYYGLPD